MMQALGRQYVRYYDYTYKRSGTLWEGRCKSCVIESSNYLLWCYRYIELNPVRAKMVNRPEEYRWSSYHANAFGKESSLRTPHGEYLSLGKSDQQRLIAYRELFRDCIELELLNAIRSSANKNLALGDDRFKLQIEENCKRRLTPMKMDRRGKKSLLCPQILSGAEYYSYLAKKIEG